MTNAIDDVPLPGMPEVEDATKPADPCYYCNGSGCADCDPALDTTPAGLVWYAASKLDIGSPTDTSVTALTANLLRTIADDMRDEHAEEKEFPDLIPSARWQVVDEHGEGWVRHPGWDEALKLARGVLGLPDPNAVGDAA